MELARGGEEMVKCTFTTKPRRKERQVKAKSAGTSTEKARRGVAVGSGSTVMGPACLAQREKHTSPGLLWTQGLHCILGTADVLMKDS